MASTPPIANRTNVGVWHQSIAFGEIVGGVLMLLTMLEAVIADSGNNLLLGMLALSASVASIIAGGLLLRKHPAGIAWSRFVVALQIMQISVGDLVYSVVMGPHVSVEFQFNGHWGIAIGIAHEAQLSWFGTWTAPFIRINLAACAALLYLA